MKSHRKQTIKENEIELIFEFSDKNGKLAKRLEQVFTTQKLPKKRNK